MFTNSHTIDICEALLHLYKPKEVPELELLSAPGVRRSYPFTQTSFLLLFHLF